MDDDRKKFPRRGASKPVGERAGGGAPRKGGKPGFAAKPRFEGGKPFKRDGEKPFAKRRDPSEVGAEARLERGDAPFRKGPRPERKPYEKREGQGAPRPGRFEREAGKGEGRFSRERGGDEKPARSFDKPRREDFDKRGRRDDFKRGEGHAKPFSRAKGVEDAPGERIAKRLARVGIASRRDAEELIAAGRIRVNGKVLESPAFNVMPDDRIELDGTLIPPVERTRLFLFHKPAGVVTTNRDPEGRKTVFEMLPAELPRLMTVGRLDINTEGLLLLTNDGGLSRVLELPATGWLRRYRARVHGKVDETQLAGLKDGIAVDGVFYGAVEASLDREQGSNAWLTIGLREGKNREVKNILGALGLNVTRLIRISFGPFQLGELPEGHVQELSGRTLRDQLGERLIEESGANFEADIQKPFSNKPVRREFAKPKDVALAERAPRKARALPIGEGGLIKRRRRDESEHREDMRERLQTRPERGAKPAFGDRPARAGKSDARESRPIDPPGARKANVWMAPGARPIGKGRAAAEKAQAEASKAGKAKFGKHGSKPFFDKPGGGKSGLGKPRREGDDRPATPRKGRDDAGRRR